MKALIFDFDGLIVDTETPIYEAWRSCYEEHGEALSLEEYVVELTELCRRFAGVHAAGEIRAVADAIVAVHRPAEITQHDLVLPDHLEHVTDARTLAVHATVPLTVPASRGHRSRW